MEEYLRVCEDINENGTLKENRTGIDTISTSGVQFKHDMSKGFPMLTTKEIKFPRVSSELEFFIQGRTDKQWLKDQGNHIWDDWCNPSIVPQGRYDPQTKDIVKAVRGDRYLGISMDVFKTAEILRDIEKRKEYSVSDEDFETLVALAENRKAMSEERDLGPVYGFQWRHFDATYGKLSENSFVHTAKWLFGGFRKKAYEIDYSGRGFDQFATMVDTLKTNPNDRRMLVSAWNPKPETKKQQALPPCHYNFQVSVRDNKLDLSWQQRSVDTPLGLPYNIASYGTLLHLLAKEANLKEGFLIGQLHDTHIYVNQLEGMNEQLSRTPGKLPQIKTDKFTSIFDWKYQDTELVGYEPQPFIKFPIAI